ncbi:hypothetical protein [Streptomyces aurantiogriseus]|nr:hypothetical protein [Streptomyces aurantiogriseus]
MAHFDDRLLKGLEEQLENWERAHPLESADPILGTVNLHKG